MVKLTIDYNRFNIVPNELINVDEVILEENNVADYLTELNNSPNKPNSIKFEWDYLETNTSNN